VQQGFNAHVNHLPILAMLPVVADSTTFFHVAKLHISVLKDERTIHRNC
jgi:hypothetical protein